MLLLRDVRLYGADELPGVSPWELRGFGFQFSESDALSFAAAVHAAPAGNAVMLSGQRFEP